MLEIERVEARYGQSQVLRGVSIAVRAGEVVSLMGRNGMGKTTTIRAIMGLKDVTAGRVIFEGQDITTWPAHRKAAAGLGLVPEGRRVFPNLSVEENLVATARPPKHRMSAHPPWTLARAYAFFPLLGERKRNLGRQLSGGEQQMVAIARALLTNPRLLILDEATEGLAPLIRAEIWRCLAALKDEGQALLVVDKHLKAISKLADRHFILEKGEVVWTGDRRDLANDAATVQRFLGVTRE